jgi:hypothetical protein
MCYLGSLHFQNLNFQYFDSLANIAYDDKQQKPEKPENQQILGGGGGRL